MYELLVTSFTALFGGVFVLMWEKQHVNHCRAFVRLSGDKLYATMVQVAGCKSCNSIQFISILVLDFR